MKWVKALPDKDADDALLCMLADAGGLAMMVIDWDASIYRNDGALHKLRAMWHHRCDANMQTSMPILSLHISQKYLGVAVLLPSQDGLEAARVKLVVA